MIKEKVILYRATLAKTKTVNIVMHGARTKGPRTQCHRQNVTDKMASERMT